MPTLKKIAFGDAGNEYVRSCLEQGTGLCTEALQAGLLDSGKTYAPLPDRTEHRRALAFDTGGITSMRGTRDWLFEHVKSLFLEENCLVFIIQDVWAKPTNPAFRSSPHRKFFTEREVYYVIPHDHLSRYVFSDAIKSVSSYLFVAFLARLNANYDLPLHDHAVDNAVIADISRGIREIYVSAYDQEGLVVWRTDSAAV